MTARPIVALLVSALLLAACTSANSGSAGPVTTASPAPSGPEAPASPSPDEGVAAASTPPAEPATPDPETGGDDGAGPTSPPPSETPASPAPEPNRPDAPAAMTIAVYWLASDASSVVAVDRTVEATSPAQAAIRALIAGPSAAEAAAGLTSAFPADTLLLGVSIAGGTATVDLSREFESGGGAAAILGRLAQLTYTVTAFPTVDRVRLRLDGMPVTAFSGEGVDVSTGLTRADFASAVPITDPPAGAAAPVWSQSELPVVTVGAADVYRVMLVAEDDVLNVRRGAGVGQPIIGKLAPGVAIRATGETRQVGSQTWRELATPAGNGWVNGRFLARSIADGDFPRGNARDVVDELARRFRDGEDFRSLVSSTGLWISHHAPLVHYDHAELAGVLDDRTTRRWGSNALGPDSPEIPARTFAAAIADTYVGAWGDDDTRIVEQQTIEGPNGRPAQHAIPVEFRGLPFVTIHDPGDDPSYDGLDWSQWIVSLVFEDGRIKVVGLTKDEWAP